MPTEAPATLDPHLQVMEDMLPRVEALLPQLKAVDESWQPVDLLPDFSGDTWQADLEDLRSEARRLTDEVLVVLVGNMITEEALPSYQTALNRFGGMTDRTGCESHAWAYWSRWWTAEEKRHGDVSHGYLALSGCVDMRAVQRSIQHLLRNGFDTGAGDDPYRGLAYASIQEHATKVSWSQLGTIAGRQGAPLLHRMCGLIAADEARHERAYRDLMVGVLERDPEGLLEALRHTLGRVVMPARTMSDARHPRLFGAFAAVGARIGVYGLRDYADNVSGFIDLLGISDLGGLRGEAAKARDEICALPARYRAQADRAETIRTRPMDFPWLPGRRV